MAVDHDAARTALHDHEHSIDTLHRKLAELASEPDKRERLDGAVKRYKSAHAAFADDVLGIVGTQ